MLRARKGQQKIPILRRRLGFAAQSVITLCLYHCCQVPAGHLGTLKTLYFAKFRNLNCTFFGGGEEVDERVSLCSLKISSKTRKTAQMRRLTHYFVHNKLMYCRFSTCHEWNGINPTYRYCTIAFTPLYDMLRLLVEIGTGCAV